ncbi:MAG: DUF4330 domain-containing protein [Oscillospiraceae bacterium]|nr:DUF4330 domain-containing protein [Oscillospiraceae bacterium]
MDKLNGGKFPGKSRRFNIIDAALIVFIIAAAAVLVYVLLGNSLFAGDEDAVILYTIEINLLRNELVPAINQITPGDEIIDSVRQQEIGKVKEVKVVDSYVNETDLDTGVVSRRPFPDHSKITVIVEAECKLEDGFKYVVKGKTIMTGIPINFRTPHFVGYGMCVYVEEISRGSKSR